MRDGDAALNEEPAPPAPAVRRPVARRRPMTADDYVRGVESGERAVLARAITLVESSNADHRRLAREVLARVMDRTGEARGAAARSGVVRVGVTGVPGVGKSTLIDQLGVNLTAAGKKVAVLAVDPTSGVTGGSILGDKTRMARLSVDPSAFIRPSPAGAALGGVASKTRETMLLCEAAGYDVVLVETVGVGQSETVVADMTDFFLVLMLPGAGDELQGIKRGLLELADLIAVNKADGDNATRARAAVGEYRTAMHYVRGGSSDGGGARPPIEVMPVSGAANIGLDRMWSAVETRVSAMASDGSLAARRRAQAIRWMWSLVDEGLRGSLRSSPDVGRVLEEVEAAVRGGRLPATAAAERVLATFLGG